MALDSKDVNYFIKESALVIHFKDIDYLTFRDGKFIIHLKNV